MTKIYNRGARALVNETSSSPLFSVYSWLFLKNKKMEIYYKYYIYGVKKPRICRK